MLLLSSLAGCGASVASEERATQRVEIDGEAFELKLALTVKQRYEGLSDVAEIPERGGMLFVFPDAARRSFVMRRCLVPIDIVFLDAGGRVVAMHEMEVEPYDTPNEELTPYPSRYPAQFAIELRGGWLDRLDVALGDRVDLPREELKARAK
ncbi:MAG: DUF192 domain-containing protein [Phycisphaeraceae bacterium]